MFGLRDYKIIVEIGKEKNLTEVAKSFNITQPAVTKIVQGLEKELGFPIFQRGIAKKWQVTPAGALLVEAVQKMVTIEKNYTDEILRCINTNEINIALMPLEAKVYANILESEVAKHSDSFSLAIDSVLPQYIEEKLITNKGKLYNLAVIALPVKQEGNLTIIPLKNYEILIVLNRDHYLAQGYQMPKDKKSFPLLDMQQLQDVPLVLPDESYKLRDKILTIYEKANLKPKIAANMVIFGETCERVAKMIKDKVAFAQSEYIEKVSNLDNAAIFRIKDGENLGAIQTVAIAYNKNKVLTENEEKVIEIIKEVIK